MFLLGVQAVIVTVVITKEDHLSKEKIINSI